MVMRNVQLAEGGFNDWRAAARALRLEGVPPAEVCWSLSQTGEGAAWAAPPAGGGAFSVSRAFLELALAVVSHPAPDRFDLLYRLLWRLGDEPGLLGRLDDADVARATQMATQIRNQGARSSVDRLSNRMIGAAMAGPTTVSARLAKSGARVERDGAYNQSAPTSLEEVAAWAGACRRCELWKHATQVVTGEGPARADVMLVGEQPGDAEDLAGRPFVGPAGQLLNRALAAAGMDRSRVYVTNAVKHFKFEPRGKRRLHKNPDVHEVAACRWWLDAERRLVKPRVIVALGASAALAVLGKATPIKANRGKPLPLGGRLRAIVTYHPAFVLRVPDEAAKHDAFTALVDDLRLARGLAS
jgi:uracil-DNA glycosylase family protein